MGTSILETNSSDLNREHIGQYAVYSHTRVYGWLRSVHIERVSRDNLAALCADEQAFPFISWLVDHNGQGAVSPRMGRKGLAVE